VGPKNFLGVFRTPVPAGMRLTKSGMSYGQAARNYEIVRISAGTGIKPRQQRKLQKIPVKRIATMSKG
jgi:hypothetical protein